MPCSPRCRGSRWPSAPPTAFRWSSKGRAGWPGPRRLAGGGRPGWSRALRGGDGGGGRRAAPGGDRTGDRPLLLRGGPEVRGAVLAGSERDHRLGHGRRGPAGGGRRRPGRASRCGVPGSCTCCGRRLPLLPARRHARRARWRWHGWAEARRGARSGCRPRRPGPAATRGEVTLVAVSKGAADEARARRLRRRGSATSARTAPRQLVARAARLPGDARWHFIGRLQGNKVRLVRPVAYLLHSLDRADLAGYWAKGPGLPPPVLVQVNVSGGAAARPGSPPARRRRWCRRRSGSGSRCGG